MTIWFTADQHFGHTNIIEYCNRPYDTIDDMDADLIQFWNRVVGRYDVVYHLGDFTLGDVEMAKKYFSLLNGTVWILNNSWHHDKRWIENYAECITRSGSSVLLRDPLEVLELKDYGKDGYPLAVSLCHYPLSEWDRKHYGGWHLHGHSHGEHKANGLILDVGVDSAALWLKEYRPFSLEEIMVIMLRKEINNDSRIT